MSGIFYHNSETVTSTVGEGLWILGSAYSPGTPALLLQVVLYWEGCLQQGSFEGCDPAMGGSLEALSFQGHGEESESLSPKVVSALEGSTD